MKDEKKLDKEIKKLSEERKGYQEKSKGHLRELLMKFQQFNDAKISDLKNSQAIGILKENVDCAMKCEEKRMIIQSIMDDAKSLVGVGAGDGVWVQNREEHYFKILQEDEELLSVLNRKGVKSIHAIDEV
jgi:hypothetical protein